MKNTEEISKYLNMQDIFLKVDLESILSAIDLIKIKVQEEKNNYDGQWWKCAHSITLYYRLE